MSGTIGGANYVLTLNAAQLTQGMLTAQQQTAASSQAIAQSLAQVTAALNNTARASQQASSSMSGGDALVANMFRLATGVGVAQFALNSLHQAVTFVGEGFLGFNDKLDRAAIAWETFTGSTEMAQAKVEQLFEFSRRTPFTFEQVDKAGRMLASFGGEALASIKNIELMGDVAAGTQRPMQMITYEVGQMVSYMQSGKAFGDAARALQGFGALTSEARTQLELMRESGASADEMLKVFFDDLGRFSGQTEKQAKTLSGAWSTFTDTMKSLIAIATREPFEQLVSGLNDVNGALDSEKAMVYAKNIGVAIQALVIGGQLLARGLQETLILIAGFMDLIIVAVLDGVDKIIAALDEIPGVDLSSQREGIQTAMAAVKADLLKQGGDLATANQEVAKLWGQAGNLEWYNAGTVNAKQYKEGLKKESSTGLDEGAAEVARAYVQAMSLALTGLSADEIEGVGDLTSFVEKALKGSKKGMKGSLDIDNLLQDLRPVLAQAVNEVSNGISNMNDTLNVDIGVTNVTSAMDKLKEMLPPEVYEQVERYVEGLRDAGLAAAALEVALISLADAQANYDEVQRQATAAMKEANDALQALQEEAKDNAEVFDTALEIRRGRIRQLDREARQANAEARRAVDEAQGELDRLRAEVEARREEQEAREKAAQDAYDELANARSQHERAIQAILQGTTEQFLEQEHAIDDVTRAILDRYAAEYEGKLRQATGDDQRATRLEREERAKLLELDERIRSLRAQGRFNEADALQKQRDAVEKRYDAEIQRARQIAQVSQDKADAEAEKIQNAADAQDRADGKAVSGAGKVLQDIKDEGEARAAVDAKALEDAEARLKAAQAHADAVAKDYADRKQAIQDEIEDIEEQKRVQAAADREKIEAAKEHKKEVDAYWKDQLANAKTNLDHATNTVTALRNQKTESDELLTALEKQTEEMSKQYGYALAILNTERARRGLPPVPSIFDGSTPGAAPTGTAPPTPIVPDRTDGPGGAPGSPTADPAPAAPAAAPSSPSPDRAGIIASWMSYYGPYHYGPAMSLEYSPPGFHVEERPTGTYWVRDGYTMLDDGSGVRADAPAASAPSGSPSGPGLTSFRAGGAGVPTYIPPPLAPSGSGLPMGAVGQTGGSQWEYKSAGNGGGSNTITLDFSGMTVDSPERADEVRGKVLGGLRQALRDVDETDMPLYASRGV